MMISIFGVGLVSYGEGICAIFDADADGNGRTVNGGQCRAMPGTRRI